MVIWLWLIVCSVKKHIIYNEAINVSIILSNPTKFKVGETTEAMAVLIDLMPTLANFEGIFE